MKPMDNDWVQDRARWSNSKMVGMAWENSSAGSGVSCVGRGKDSRGFVSVVLVSAERRLRAPSGTYRNREPPI